MTRIVCVIDDGGWVQAARVRSLAARLPELGLRPVTLRRFAVGRRLGRYRRRPLYFAGWRQLRVLREAYGVELDDGELGRAMTSVTSHYELGGGLNEAATALPPGLTADEARAAAIALLGRFAVVTANSTGLYDLLASGLPRLLYAPNGVEAELFRPPAARDYDPERPRVGWAGKFKAAKNVEALHGAIAALEPEGFRFELVGAAKTEAPQLDLHGMRAFYHRLDWYLCTSWHEGTPNPALEAAASGVPLITTRVGNMVDLVREGENGFFVEPNAESVVERLRGLRGLAAAEHARLGDAARATVEAEWSWDRNVGAYRTAFTRLLAAS